MKFCNKCGDKVENGEKFCNKCGNKLEEQVKFCNKCGDIVEPGEKFCNKCGNLLVDDNKKDNNIDKVKNNLLNNFNKLNLKQKNIFIGVSAGVITIILLFLVSSILNNSSKYYFDEKKIEDGDGNVENLNKTDGTINSKKKSKYATSVVYDNTYSGITVKNDKEAYDLIVKDSIEQKKNCPSEINKIEEEITKKYGINAVNLCELDINFAKELVNVLKVLYDEYPIARGIITNLTLVNGSLKNNYIAAFMPVFLFGTTDSDSTYPWVIKTQILLNSSYFLNQERLKTSVIDSSKSGHFPPNATIYSPVAHEFGHYLSFLSLMKEYQEKKILIINDNNINNLNLILDDFSSGKHSLDMITEAYNKYKNKVGTDLQLDQWRGTISQYALAKDNSGNYIYDETIAESFHDVYLNKENAKDASKYIIDVLKSRLEVK